ncbi:MAG: ATP12 family protein [Pseudomonadota bacterium]
MTQLADSAKGPKRFYERAEAAAGEDGAFAIHLDGRVAKTPLRNALATPHEGLAQAVAQEWADVDEEIDTSRMPLTKLLATLIDLGEAEQDAWRRTVTDYLQSDLLCYRAGEPAALAGRQCEVWDPYLERWASVFGTPLRTVTGVIATSQSAEALARADEFLSGLRLDHLLAVKCATEITGSAVLAVSLATGANEPGEIFAASRLDERFQEERWGTDAEAKDRERALEREFGAIVRFLALTPA